MSTNTDHMINSVQQGDISQFKTDFDTSVSQIISDKLDDLKSDTINNIKEAAEATDTSAEDEMVLDPSMAKEYFLKRLEHEGHEIVLKKLGLGPTKPISVYIDGKRWEIFPGPKVAKREAKRYVEKLNKETEESNPETDKSIDNTNNIGE